MMQKILSSYLKSHIQFISLIVLWK